MKSMNENEETNKKGLSQKLINYVINNSDLETSDLEKLRQCVPNISDTEFEQRIYTIVDFFIRSRKAHWKNKIYNEVNYAKRIIVSDSFFENQNWISNIPTVEETDDYLKERRLDDLLNPSVNEETFHKNVLQIKRLYHDSVFFDSNQNNTDSEKRMRSQRDYMLAFEKLDDETLKEELIMDIKELYKQFRHCELEYILFKNMMINVYLFNGKDRYQAFKKELKKHLDLTFDDLIHIKQILTH
ncbi:MAG TPA: hypothetical protein PK466_01570 [Thermotogota bacterium]|nr:hypothetical protein [Thermotogota bacterium]HPJ87896.1 hypothetical protein [Thermotogota bacterium]HPR94989.1 hypothetical protein [Thermotogota bacterium]